MMSKNPKNHRINYRVILFIIILLNLALQFTVYKNSFLDDPELSVLDVSYRELNISFLRTGTPHPPLRYFIIRVWAEIFGIENVRLLSILFGAASVFLVYHVGGIMFNRKVGLLASFLASINPLLLQQSNFGDFYTLFLFFSLFQFYIFIKFVKFGKKELYFLLLLASITTLQIHFYSLILFLVEFIYAFLNHRKKIKKLLFLFAIVLLTLLPQLLLSFSNGVYDSPYDEPWHDILYPSLLNRFSLQYREFVDNGMGYFGILSIFLFYLMYIRSKDKHILPRLLFVLCPILFIIISFFIYVRHYQLIFMLPFYLIYLSNYLFSIKSNKVYFFLALFLVLNLFWLQTIYSKTLDIEYMAYIESNFEEGDILIVDNFEAFRIDYYSNLTYEKSSFKSFSEPQSLVNAGKTRTWFVYHIELAYIDSFYFNNSFSVWLEKNCKLSYPGSYNVYLC